MLVLLTVNLLGVVGVLRIVLQGVDFLGVVRVLGIVLQGVDFHWVVRVLGIVLLVGWIFAVFLGIVYNVNRYLRV